ncbi:SDR family oxidoreductase [Streptomyces griseus]|uniref:SDR family oxidoreductase n=1 Tax=Streptomyces griseus TaxID=1911 RepID=UPI0036AF9252
MQTALDLASPPVAAIVITEAAFTPVTSSGPGCARPTGRCPAAVPEKGCGGAVHEGYRAGPARLRGDRGIPDEGWLRIFEVNVLSDVRLARHYAPRVIGRGWGRVIFVSSGAGVQAPSDWIHYGKSKTAQLAVSHGMAQEVAGAGSRLPACCPDRP